MRAVSNPPNPWHTVHAGWLGEPPAAQLEVFEEKARTIIAENDSPDVGFRFSVNPYRGCFHACSYCASGETPILMADGRTKPLASVRTGDEVYGTIRVGRYRRYVKTSVLHHWCRIEPAYRIELEDGTKVASADHRFLTNRGWKRVTGREQGRLRRPHLSSKSGQAAATTAVSDRACTAAGPAGRRSSGSSTSRRGASASATTHKMSPEPARRRGRRGRPRCSRREIPDVDSHPLRIEKYLTTMWQAHRLSA